ncbi:MAG: hypothetical protein ACE5F5_11800 [Acidimicrobiia bacterium]
MTTQRRRRRRRPSSEKPQQPLHNPRGIQERILVFGVEGTGKSEAWISIAVAAQESGSEAHFYVIDTDGSAAVSLLSHPKLDNVSIWQASDPDGYLLTPDGGETDYSSWWEAWSEAARQIRAKRPGRDDWIIVDRLDRMWDAVQSWWIEKAYGEDENAYWAELRAEQVKAKKESGKGTDRDYGGFQGNRDWVQIKKVYNKAVLGLLAGPPCHKLAVCLEKDIFPGGKAAQLRGLYGETMPAGKGDQGADFWLTVQLKRSPGGDHLVFVRRTKDRGFENPGAVDITDVGFAEGFLKDVWGWR